MTKTKLKMNLRPRKLIAIIITISCLLINLKSTFCQTGDAGDAGAFLKYGVGVRGATFGEAFTAIASDPAAIYYNPAGITFAKSFQGELSINKPFTNIDGIQHYSLATILPIAGINFGFGASMLAVSDIQETIDRTGPTESTFDDRELAIFLSNGFALTDNIAIGASLKAISQEIYTYSTMGYGFDMSMLYHTKKFNTGLIFRDLVGATLKLNERADQVPLKITFAMSYKPFNRLTIATGLLKSSDRTTSLHPAVDFELLNKLLYLRESYSSRTKAVKLGFSLCIAGLHLDYFYSLNNELGDSSSFGLRWKKDK